MYSLINKTLSYIIGQHCVLCDTAISDPNSDLCSACRTDAPVVTHACQSCGIQLKSEYALYCGTCAITPPSYDHVISAFAYASPIKQLITQFKFQRKLSLAPVFTQALLSKLDLKHIKIDALLPVPLHPARLRQRGYNQAIELARPLARAIQRPLIINQVVRSKNTANQSNLLARERIKNMCDAFYCPQPFGYKSIAIIDDVMTTGSTVNALAKCLKEKGTKHVEVWCIARANT